jgi:hypothetical protein
MVGDRQLIANHQVALGMISKEVQQSLGKPTRKNIRIAIIGREERPKRAPTITKKAFCLETYFHGIVVLLSGLTLTN